MKILTVILLIVGAFLVGMNTYLWITRDDPAYAVMAAFLLVTGTFCLVMFLLYLEKQRSHR